mmetsp:Transcript_86264/g.241439  ORF Transcript_86264/g.241439 Transcript_86264/m.241439 type:complete len:240 (-) Transcript_86264:104-823(-)
MSCIENFPAGTGCARVASSMTMYFVAASGAALLSGSSMIRRSGARTNVSTDQEAQRASASDPSCCTSFRKVNCKCGWSSGSGTKLSNCIALTRWATVSPNSSSAFAQMRKPACAGYSFCSKASVGTPFCVSASPGSKNSTAESMMFRCVPSMCTDNTEPALVASSKMRYQCSPEGMRTLFVATPLRGGSPAVRWMYSGAPLSGLDGCSWLMDWRSTLDAPWPAEASLLARVLGSARNGS